MFQGGRLRVFFDNNFWDYLAYNNVNLRVYFPENKYELFITTHGKYEMLQLSSDDKQYVRAYALNALDTTVKEDAVFGFHSDLFPIEYQRSSGFGAGRFADIEEESIRYELNTKYWIGQKRKESQILFKQEADIELAVRSLKHPVITFDAKKKGPLLYALKKGWKVIPLDFERSKDIAVEKFLAEIVDAIDKKA